MASSESNRLPVNRKLLGRLFAKIEVSSELTYRNDPCWIWTGYVSQFGYGSTSYALGNGRYKKLPVHRLMFQLFIAQVSDELVIDHLCRVTTCCNPVHLEAVPQQINVLRSRGLGAINAQKTHCPQGHPLTGSNLVPYALKRGHRSCRICCNANARRRNERPRRSIGGGGQSPSPKRPQKRGGLETLQERIAAKLVISPVFSYHSTPCWEWTGYITPDGYGRMAVNFGGEYSFETIHRLIYVLVYGAIPAGLVIDHLCRVRHCANPYHLEAVTPRENNMRGAGAAAQNARKTHCVKGHPLEGRNLVGKRNRQCRTCLYASNRRVRQNKKNRPEQV